jgi:hypothetical protein
MRRTIAVLVLLLGAATVAGAVVCPAPLALMIRSAQRIVVLRIDQLTIETDEGQPFTLATAAVSETLKGPHETPLRLRLPGGRVGGFVMVVPGAPTLRAGDEYLAFLAPDDNPRFAEPAWRSFNLGEGLFALIRKSGRTWAVQATGDAPQRFAACTAAADQCAAQAGAMVEELSVLKARIREVLAPGPS